MGSSATSSTSPSRYQFDPRPWALIGEGDHYRILRNTSNGDELEEYLHTATDNRQFDFLRSMFEYRLDKEYLVATKFFRQEDRNQMCSTFFQGFLYTERIPLRMNEIRDLPFPDIVHLVNSCLRGFRQLYLKTGGFNVNQHMIGINGDAKVKVWLSQDFGSDRPDDLSKDERAMVQQILEIIDKNIDKRTQPQSIIQALTRNGLPTFDSAIAVLNQYTIRHVISIPPYLTSIAELRDKGYFKKMHPKQRSGVIPLEPSINRSLPLITKSYMSSNDQIVTNSPQQLGIQTTKINIIPPLPSINIDQQTTGINCSPPISQLPLVSPLSIPLSEPNSHKLLISQQKSLTDVHRIPLQGGIQGIPINKVNHLQSHGKQPLVHLAQKYPPPADYSPSQSPPPHLKGHRTEVRSWMSPPITRDGSSVQRVIRTNTPTKQQNNPIIRPTTPSFGKTQNITKIVPPSQVTSYTKAIPRTVQRSPSSSDYLNIKPTSATPTFKPDPFIITKLQQTPKTTYTDKFDSKYDTFSTKFDTTKYEDTYTTKYEDVYTTKYDASYQKPSNLPMIIIPNKIQLTVTKITNHEPEGISTQNFVLNPNQSNVHHGLIKEIIQHTIGLQDCMKDGAYNNPTITGQRTTQQIKFGDYKDRSRVSTTNYSQYSTPSRRDDGLTDPALLQHAVKGIASIIDSKKPFQSKSYDQTLGSFESFNVKTSDFSSNSYYPKSQSQQSSAQIMAIVSQALKSHNNVPNNKYRASQISQIESVQYDSRPGSLIR